MPALDVVLREATSRLAAAGVASPRADAELLAAQVIGGSRGEVLAAALRGTALTADQADVLEALVVRREAREPLQHLTGRAAFRSLELLVGPGVFVPRPETEVLAGLAVEAASGLDTPLVVDLCTGSGAVALAVADEVPQARVVAVEKENDAFRWACRNREVLGLDGADTRGVPRVDLRRGDAVDAHTGVLADLVTAGPDGRPLGTADVVVANPPYIPPDMVPVDPEVAEHDPRAALYGGGPDGLDVPRGVVRAAAGLLRPGGLLLMEHADVQGPATRALVAGDGWQDAVTLPDLAGRDRVLRVRRTDSRR